MFRFARAATAGILKGARASHARLNFRPRVFSLSTRFQSSSNATPSQGMKDIAQGEKQDITDDATFIQKDISIAEVLQQKTEKAKSLGGLLDISQNDSVFNAIKKMNDYKVGALLVREPGENKIAGIITERDYLTKVALKGRDSRKTPVSVIMTEELFYAKASSEVSKCLAVMTEKRFRHLPVLDEQQKYVVGIISIGDLVRASLGSLKEEVDYLRDFVTGKYEYTFSSNTGERRKTAVEPLDWQEMKAQDDKRTR